VRDDIAVDLMQVMAPHMEHTLTHLLPLLHRSHQFSGKYILLFDPKFWSIHFFAIWLILFVKKYISARIYSSKHTGKAN
jgi:hypothetical protein